MSKYNLGMHMDDWSELTNINLFDTLQWEYGMVLVDSHHDKCNFEIGSQFCPHKMLFRTVGVYQKSPNCTEFLESSLNYFQLLPWLYCSWLYRQAKSLFQKKRKKIIKKKIQYCFNNNISFLFLFLFFL